MRRGKKSTEVSELLLLAPAPRRFVKVVFLLLAIAFLLPTLLLVVDYPTDWATLLVAHSHRFFFFPVLGLAALACFYIPSVVLTDLYWRGGVIPAGRIRYWLAFVAVSAFSAYVALGFAGLSPLEMLSPSYRAAQIAATETTPLRRSIWELSPLALARNAEAGIVEIPGCRTFDGRACRRLPIVTTLQTLRDEGMRRWTITEFARTCVPDTLVELPPTHWVERLCFPAGQRLNTPACCQVQASLEAEVARLLREPEMRSRVGVVENVATAFKSFFVIVVIVVGLLLAFWRNKLLVHYRNHLDAIERGVIVGAGLMLIWLLMDYGYQQTADVMFGRRLRGFPVRASLAVGVLAMALIIYFLNRSVYNVAQLSTIGASVVAVANYELIGNLSARLLGSGAHTFTFAGLVLVAVGAVILVYGPWKLPLPPRRGENAAPQLT